MYAKMNARISAMRFLLLNYFSAIFLIAFNWIYWRRMVYAAQEMHSKLANRLLRYPMNFFDTTPIGRILNRVSRDVDTVDSTLPVHVKGVLVHSSTVLVTIIVIMSVSPITGAVLFPVILVYYFCQVTQQCYWYVYVCACVHLYIGMHVCECFSSQALS